MRTAVKVTNDITWIGANDRRIHLFENVYPVPDGVTYNSYFINDEKTALVDTVDKAEESIFRSNLEYVLDGRSLDYIVINHMEPDHSAALGEIMRKYPGAMVVASGKAIGMMEQFGIETGDRTIKVDEGDSLKLGRHELHFVMAPLVHWPEVMMTYDSYERILFSADGFGSFGAFDGSIFADFYDYDGRWMDESRRYYTNIVGKYGPQVHAVLEKAAGLDIRMICPLHGPVWRSNLGLILDKYDRWSSYTPEQNGILVVYGCIHENMKNTADMFASMLYERGVGKIRVCDASKTHPSYLIAEAFRNTHIVIMADTYNAGIFTPVAHFIDDVAAHAIKGRRYAVVDNGSWAPVAGKRIIEKMDAIREMTLIEPAVSFKSSPAEADIQKLSVLADAVASDMK